MLIHGVHFLQLKLKDLIQISVYRSEVFQDSFPQNKFLESNIFFIDFFFCNLKI